jgi:hypothetical protein
MFRTSLLVVQSEIKMMNQASNPVQLYGAILCVHFGGQHAVDCDEVSRH